MAAVARIDPRWSALEREAQTRFKVKAFRAGQRELIDAVLAGEDAFGVLATGGGKSLCYQLPSLFLPKPTVVVSPLIALTKDQCEHMERVHVDAAELDSTLTVREERASEIEIRNGEHPLIYVTPERLQSDACIAMLQTKGIALLAVDEAHCVSQWGHDFRPAYTSIGEAARKLGRPPIMALTATATPDVSKDILAQLGLRNPRVVRTSVARDNLTLQVLRTVNEDEKRLSLARVLHEESGSGIVYVTTIKMADELFEWLGRSGFEVARYHAQLPIAERSQSYERFMSGEARIMVATKAFGMGIDKKDIRWVVHHQFPDSLESYYQEAGRGGRDGKPARAVLLYQLEDRRVQSYFLAGKHPRKKEVLWVYDAIVAANGAVAFEALMQATNVHERRIEVLASDMRHLGIADVAEDKIAKKTKTHDAKELEALLQVYEVRRAGDRERLHTFMKWAQSTECRMRGVLAYFGETASEGCGRCDNCVQHPRGIGQS